MNYIFHNVEESAETVTGYMLYSYVIIKKDIVYKKQNTYQQGKSSLKKY